MDILSLKELTWKTACLVSLATSKRMADMSLMSVKRDSMYMSGDHIQFQLTLVPKLIGQIIILTLYTFIGTSKMFLCVLFLF